jgi:hypothetical protein
MRTPCSISERSTANADDGMTTTPRAFAFAAKSSARQGGGSLSQTNMQAGSVCSNDCGNSSRASA